MTRDDIDAVYADGIEIPEYETSRLEAEMSPFYPKERLHDWVTVDSDVLLVAEDQNEIVGHFLSHHHPATGIAYLENLYVASNHRRAGIGTNLMKTGLTELERKGARYVVALVKPENRQIAGLLDDLSFTEGHTFTWWDKLLD